MTKPLFSQVDAVIFDLDGTLIASEHVWMAAKTRIAAQYGVTVSQQTLDAHVGRRVADFVTQVVNHDPNNPVPVEAAVQEIVDLALLTLARDLIVMPGATALVRHLAATGMTLAICSSAPMRAIRIALEVMAIGECFTTLVSAEAMPKGKPDPEPYLETLAALSCAPHRVLAIEDSLAGVRSAKAAGLFTIAVGGDAQVAASHLADIEFGALADIPLD